MTKIASKQAHSSCRSIYDRWRDVRGRQQPLTLGELYAGLGDINSQANTFGGVAYARNFGETAEHLNYAVARSVPEPGLLVLLAIGFFGLIAVRRRHAQRLEGVLTPYLLA